MNLFVLLFFLTYISIEVENDDVCVCGLFIIYTIFLLFYHYYSVFFAFFFSLISLTPLLLFISVSILVFILPTFISSSFASGRISFSFFLHSLPFHLVVLLSCLHKAGELFPSSLASAFFYMFSPLSLSALGCMCLFAPVCASL